MFGLNSKSKKYVKEYEKAHNITLSKEIKKFIEEDVKSIIIREEKPADAPKNTGASLLQGFKMFSHCVCYTDEDYDKYVNAVIIFYARYATKVYKMIEAEGIKVSQVNMRCSFFKAIVESPDLTDEEITDIIGAFKKPDIHFIWK